LIYAFIVIFPFMTRLDEASHHHPLTSTKVTVPKEARKDKYV